MSDNNGFFDKQEYVVWDGQHKYTIIRETVDMFHLPTADPEMQERVKHLWDDNRNPFEESKQFADNIMEVFGPYLSIRDIRCWLDALADQYEQHWTWRNQWAKEEGKADEAIELTDAKPFEEVNGRT